ncbi:TetR/AcrR family transcriptional regulator [Candidatus Frankia alpina]|uniref:TetR/AcrR family transcriptional regulator n=1 Tax=Candidatus Frankia alpina TaxID=2699483 RepID=UPI0013D163D7|nr:TetR family transcriptional regulator [Candidatus Frankia alpina]
MPEQQAESLRERKKRRTRQSIIDVAHALFHVNDYDTTTVEAIAAGAEVSVRTFFRYFANKEEVALAPLDEMGELTLTALRRRPADEPPLTALRAAVLDAWTIMSPDGESLRHYTDHLLPIGKASALAGAAQNRIVALGDRFALEFVEGDDAGGPQPRTDLHASLAAFAFLAAVQVAVRAWCASDSTDPADLVANALICLDSLVVERNSAHRA